MTVNDVMGELGGMLSDGWEVTVPSGWDGMFPGEIGGMTAGITRVGEVFVAIATAILVAGGHCDGGWGRFGCVSI